MTIYFQDRFKYNDDSHWTNVATTGGPVDVTNEEKRVQGSGNQVGNLGFFGPVLPNIPLAGKVIQSEFLLESGAVQSIGIARVSLSNGLGDVATFPGGSVNWNSFPTPRFVMFDENGGTISGATPLLEMKIPARYTFKFQFNSNGTVSGYVTRLPDFVNYLIGTTVTANYFTNGPVFFSASQTFMSPSTKKSFWDNIFAHDEGLDFLVPLEQSEAGMAASKTEIANLAISHLGVAKEIGNLDTEKSQEAGACRKFYDLALETTLRDFDWPFATKYETLGLIESDPNDEWDFSYRYPSDALKIRKILSGTRNDTRQSRIPFVEGQDNSGKLIFTDQEDAQVKYTPFTTNVALYPPDFIMALSLRLAAYVAPRITGGDPFKMGDRAIKLYMYELSKAESNSGNEEQEEENPESEYIRARQ